MNVAAHSAEELEVLRRQVEQLTKEKAELLATNRLQAFEIEKLKRQLWSPKSERYVPGEDQQRKFFEEPEAAPSQPAPEKGRSAQASAGSRGARSRWIHCCLGRRSGCRIPI